MRRVLDCNVVIAAGVTHGVCARAVVTAIRRDDLVLSDGVRSEYHEVASRPKLRRARARLDEIMAALEAVAIWVEPGRRSGVCPKDLRHGARRRRPRPHPQCSRSKGGPGLSSRGDRSTAPGPDGAG